MLNRIPSAKIGFQWTGEWDGVSIDSRPSFLRATRSEWKSEIMQINGKKEKKLGRREKKMAAKWYQLSKWEGMSMKKAWKVADCQIKDPMAVPYFFFALAPPLCSLPIQSDSKGKLDTARRLA